MKLQHREQKSGKLSFHVAVPAAMKKALRWSDDQPLALCPDQDSGILRIIPLKI